MKLIDVLRRECIVAKAEVHDKAAVLKYIAQTAKRSPVLKDVPEDEIHTGLLKREELGSTGFGKGIAIPHCRLKSVTDFVVGIITVPSGVEFDALDLEPVKLIIFIIAPEAKSNAHLQLLSAISQTLLIPGAIKEILAESTDEAVCESFLRHTHAEIDTKKQVAKVMFNVFIHDEKFFHDIIEKLNGIETSSIVVFNTENTEAYLAKVPLFAEFWQDKSSRFSKVINMVIDKGLVNESVRRIEEITGNLNECSGVMVTVQDVFYSAGSL